MNQNFSKELNKKQFQAVEILSGPLLVLAGAGSGKTRVLTYRIANLMANGVPGNEILAVTFTNKAAKEMEERISKILNKSKTDSRNNFRLHGFSSDAPTVGTFHAICVRILREEIEKLQNGLTGNFVIFDTSDAQKLMKLIMKEHQIDEKEFKVRAILSHISTAKNQLKVPHHYQYEEEDNQFTEVVKKLFPIYQKRLIDHNALDFDDLLQKTVQVFEAVPAVLKKYRSKWNQVLVDEYQDTNFAQYRLIRLLADEHQNLCVVGDDHQSIYAFRGADFRNILDFEKDFKKAQTVKLEQNYRSTANILANANKLISYNETGREKNLWTKNKEGDLVKITEVLDEKDEGRLISDKIRELQEMEDTNLKNIAILYRMNAQSRAIEESLMRNRIPYQIIGGVRFFDRKEIKDVLAYLRLIFNGRDDVSFLRIINVPSRKIGKVTIDVLQKYAKAYTMSLFEILEAVEEIPELNEKKRAVLKNFQKIILDLREIAEKEPISILLDRLIERVEFVKFLDDGSSEGEAKVQNIQELFSVAGRYDIAENSLAAFLEGVALISDVDRMENQDSVTLMTVHAAKGLEFPVVFLPGWEENIFPSSKAQYSRDTLEEERRLGYVAITRAEQKCFISHARRRLLFGQIQGAMPSKFISELEKECYEKTSTVMSESGSSFSRGRNFSAKEYLSATPRRRLGDKDTTYKENPQIVDLSNPPKNKKEALFGVSENETAFKIGDKILHDVHGEGTIILILGDVFSIAFPGKGIKKLVASVEPISKIEEDGGVSF